jgi:hypothetical protein
MRFDAIYFIDLCQRSGFKLTRQGHLLCYDYRGKRIKGADFFIEAMRQHKTELLPLLTDTREVIQLDIFDDDK